MITGYATPEGTKKFAERQNQDSHKNYKNVHNLTLSNVGIGTYLGNPDTETDYIVQDAIKKSILGGINVIDSAINYRAQKAERSVGNAISQLIDNDDISREEIFVSTKNGYVTNDGDIKEDLMQYVMREYGKTGIVKEGDISPGYHCMTLPYLNDQLERSLKNLGMDCVDLMYLHNSVEGQTHLPSEQFLKNLKDVYEFYEKNKDRAEFIANELNDTIVINGDGLDEDVLKEANIQEAETILSLTNDDEDNIMVSVLAEKNNPNKRTIALVNKQIYSLLQTSLKIDDLVDPRLTTVSTILKHVHKGTIETVYTLLDGEYEFIEAEVLETSELISKSIKDSNLPKEIRIGAVVRGKDVVIP